MFRRTCFIFHYLFFSNLKLFLFFFLFVCQRPEDWCIVSVHVFMIKGLKWSWSFKWHLQSLAMCFKWEEKLLLLLWSFFTSISPELIKQACNAAEGWITIFCCLLCNGAPRMMQTRLDTVWDAWGSRDLEGGKWKFQRKRKKVIEDLRDVAGLITMNRVCSSKCKAGHDAWLGMQGRLLTFKKNYYFKE